MALSFILYFSDIGPDFYMAMAEQELTPEDLEIVNNVRENNRLLNIEPNVGSR